MGRLFADRAADQRELLEQQQATIKQAENRQSLLSQLAIQATRGGQPGPHAETDPLTGLSLPFGQQSPAGQAHTLGLQEQAGLSTSTLEQLQALDPATPMSAIQQQQLATSAAQERNARLSGDLTQSQISGLPARFKLETDKAMREMQASEVKSARDFQTAVQNNAVIQTGVNGLNRLTQLYGTLTAPNSSELDYLNAAILVTQIIEPGLATRNDDRMAFKEGASPGLINLAAQINQLIGGEVDREVGKANVLRSARNLLKPLMSGTRDALEFWRERAVSTPGVKSADVSRLLGIGPLQESQLAELLDVEDI